MTTADKQCVRDRIVDLKNKVAKLKARGKKNKSEVDRLHDIINRLNSWI